METMSELYDIKKLPEVMFTLSFKLIDQYQQEDPILTKNLILQNILRLIFVKAGIL